VRAEFGGTVELVWKSFLLKPYPKPVPLEEFRRYTRSWARPAAQGDGGRFREWSTQEAPPTHSLPPNVAVKAAARLGGEAAFDAYHHAVMDAYFYANRNVSDEAVLVDIAASCGLDPERFRAQLHDDALVRTVWADHGEAVERGVCSVPTVVAGEDFLIPGAQDLAFYRHLFTKLLQNRL
jgi:predicted DsbA family dithiol-disulfide isomerase